MAVEWYLLKPPHSQVSGFEAEALDDFGAEGFAEFLDSGMADDIELYNYDLSECTPMKAIVENTMQDTKLQALSRHLIVPIGTCKAGMYVKHHNRFWLIVGMVDNNGIYEKAVMAFCNYKLSWINDNGEITQRWANIVSASQYNNGETSTERYFVRSDQLLVSIPDDDISLMLHQGQRFIVDKRCDVYERNFAAGTEKDTSKPVITYQITRIDSVLYSYQDSGHQELMFTQDEKMPNDGYYLVDGTGYWLCEQPEIDVIPEVQPYSQIVYDDPDIYIGLEPTVFTAYFYDSEGIPVEVAPQWRLNCSFIEYLHVQEVENAIMISVKNKNLNGRTFELILENSGFEPSSVLITIKAFI